MRIPLLYKVYWALRRGWKRISPEARRAIQAFVASEKTGGGYMNAGGGEDAYYKQFGEVLEAVFSPLRLLGMRISLSAEDGRQTDTIYKRFFRFIEAEKQIVPKFKIDKLSFVRLPSRLGQMKASFQWRSLLQEFKIQKSRANGGRSALKALLTNLPPARTTNAACCILAMQHQTKSRPDPDLLAWLHERQDESGGFRATEEAPVPDLLSTAVALFTLRLLGTGYNCPLSIVHCPLLRDASDFIHAHWLDSGGFTPTVFDNYSDVEYVFYGLLALGSL